MKKVIACFLMTSILLSSLLIFNVPVNAADGSHTIDFSLPNAAKYVLTNSYPTQYNKEVTWQYDSSMRALKVTSLPGTDIERPDPYISFSANVRLSDYNYCTIVYYFPKPINRPNNQEVHFFIDGAWGNSFPDTVNKYTFTAVGQKYDYVTVDLSRYSGTMIDAVRFDPWSWAPEMIGESMYLEMIIFSKDRNSALETVNNRINNNNKLHSTINCGDYNGHYYAVFSNPLDWNTAKGYCASMGGYLVSIESRSENDYITSLIKGTNEEGYLIGLSNYLNGTYSKWESGSDVSYTNWGYSQPDNSANDQHTVRIMNYDNVTWNYGDWDDYGNYSTKLPFICEWESVYDIPEFMDEYGKFNENASDTEITICVKAKNTNGALINADGAVVYLFDGFINYDYCIGKETVKNGIVTFSQNSIYNMYQTEYNFADNIDNWVVEAILSIPVDYSPCVRLELSSNYVDSNGEWKPYYLNSFADSSTYLRVDEPRLYFDMSAGYVSAESNCTTESQISNMLTSYRRLFANTTNGHCILNNYSIYNYPKYSKLEKSDCDIVFSPDHITPHTTPYKRILNFKDYSKKYNHIFMNADNIFDSLTLCHESCHYLFGVKDEYCYGKGYGKNNSGYWNDFVVDDFGNKPGTIPRPDNAPKPFGVMEDPYNSLELSNYYTYDYLGNNRKVNKKSPNNYTAQYYDNGMSCEEQLASVLTQLANNCGYFADYTCSKCHEGQTEDYLSFSSSLLLNESISLYGDLFYSPSFYSNNESRSPYSESLETSELLSDFDISFDGEMLNISVDNECICYIEDTEEDIITQYIDSDFAIQMKNDCYLFIVKDIDGQYYCNSYSVSLKDAIPMDTADEDIPQEYCVVFSDSENCKFVIIEGNCKMENGAYLSLAPVVKIAASEEPAELYIDCAVNSNQSLDCTGMTWFHVQNDDWGALDSSKYIGEAYSEHYTTKGIASGTYVLMGKRKASSSESSLYPVSNILADSESCLYDYQIKVMFDDSNDSDAVRGYQVYYSETPFSYSHDADKSIFYPVSVYHSNNGLIINNYDSFDKMYISVEVIGNNGERSDISDTIEYSFVGKDENGDGIPDAWCSKYGFSFSAEIATSDNDNDGLTNFQEYCHGTNPYSVDTDKDNVYDGMEIYYGLNPLLISTDGITIDSVKIYGEPDIDIDNDTIFADKSNAVCFIKNNSYGKAMHISVGLYNGDELLASWNVNLDSFSESKLVFPSEYITQYGNALKVIADYNRIGNDLDYANNTLTIDKTVSLGDVNKDGKINTKDSLILRKYIAGLNQFDGIQELAADLNKSGEVSLADVLLIRRYLARIIMSID